MMRLYFQILGMIILCGLVNAEQLKCDVIVGSSKTTLSAPVQVADCDQLGAFIETQDEMGWERSRLFNSRLLVLCFQTETFHCSGVVKFYNSTILEEVVLMGEPCIEDPTVEAYFDSQRSVSTLEETAKQYLSPSLMGLPVIKQSLDLMDANKTYLHSQGIRITAFCLSFTDFTATQGGVFTTEKEGGIVAYRCVFQNCNSTTADANNFGGGAVMIFNALDIVFVYNSFFNCNAKSSATFIGQGAKEPNLIGGGGAISIVFSTTALPSSSSYSYAFLHNRFAYCYAAVDGGAVSIAFETMLVIPCAANASRTRSEDLVPFSFHHNVYYGCSAAGFGGGAVSFIGVPGNNQSQTTTTNSLLTALGDFSNQEAQMRLSFVNENYTSCYASAFGLGGGGALSIFASPVVTNITSCRFQGCASIGGQGGGSASVLGVSALDVKESVFVDSTSLSSTMFGGGSGGAMNIEAAQEVLIRRSTIRGSTAVTKGGGIHAGGMSNVIIRDCNFSSNVDGNYGGDLMISDASSTLRLLGQTSFQVSEPRKLLALESQCQGLQETVMNFHFVGTPSLNGKCGNNGDRRLSPTELSMVTSYSILTPLLKQLEMESSVQLSCPRGFYLLNNSALNSIVFDGERIFSDDCHVWSTASGNNSCYVQQSLLSFKCRPCQMDYFGGDNIISEAGCYRCKDDALQCFGASTLKVRRNYWVTPIVYNRSFDGLPRFSDGQQVALEDTASLHSSTSPLPLSDYVYFLPHGYGCASTDGCFAFENGEVLDTCGGNRRGTLCGKCKKGHSFGVLTTTCVPSTTCREQKLWIFLLTIGILTLLYIGGLFLMPQIAGTPAFKSIVYFFNVMELLDIAQVRECSCLIFVHWLLCVVPHFLNLSSRSQVEVDSSSQVWEIEAAHILHAIGVVVTTIVSAGSTSGSSLLSSIDFCLLENMTQIFRLTIWYFIPAFMLFWIAVFLVVNTFLRKIPLRESNALGILYTAMLTVYNTMLKSSLQFLSCIYVTGKGYRLYYAGEEECTEKYRIAGGTISLLLFVLPLWIPIFIVLVWHRLDRAERRLTGEKEQGWKEGWRGVKESLERWARDYRSRVKKFICRRANIRHSLRHSLSSKNKSLRKIPSLRRHRLSRTSSVASSHNAEPLLHKADSDVGASDDGVLFNDVESRAFDERSLPSLTRQPSEDALHLSCISQSELTKAKLMRSPSLESIFKKGFADPSKKVSSQRATAAGISTCVYQLYTMLEGPYMPRAFYWELVSFFQVFFSVDVLSLLFLFASDETALTEHLQVMIYRRTVLVIGVVFLKNMAQMSMYVACLCIFFFGWHTYISPFRSRTGFVVEAMSLFFLAIVASCQILISGLISAGSTAPLNFNTTTSTESNHDNGVTGAVTSIAFLQIFVLMAGIIYVCYVVFEKFVVTVKSLCKHLTKRRVKNTK